MDSIIEATSLSAVTELAANPPFYPNTGAPPSSLPLVLYIARVPGSRDVFLTPIKPREKVVTASDVQSSLYYVHVNYAEDYDQQRHDRLPPQRPSSANANAGNLLPVGERPRKAPPPLPRRSSQRTPLPYPVDDTPPYPIENGPPIIQAAPPSPRQAGQRITRKPIVSNVTNAFPSSQPGLNLPIIPPRPLPTPPAEERSSSESSLHEDNIRLLRKSSHTDEHENPYSRSYSSHPETLKQLDLDTRPAPGSLTLIRRDPGSNDQWNVATIHDHPAQENSSSSSLLVPTASRRTNKGGAPLYLDITNPGYVQFIDSRRPESRISTSSPEEDPPPPQGTFRRRLYMPDSPYVENRYSNYENGGHRKHFSLSSASGEEDAMRRSVMHGERHSVDMGSVNSESPNGADRVRSKGYTFTSPWNGTCDFTTGLTGKSLKCRHRFSNGALGSGTTTTEVSELRFNLPTTHKKSLEGKQSRSSYFQHLRHHSSEQDAFDDGGSTPSIMVDEDGRIDLSLGQEKAGGGFGGKQAKLGKLIVMPEGLGMLDLLVAANLGLWWRAWERL